jgi:t-SNARE complex subunit (syntaxin)
MGQERGERGQERGQTETEAGWLPTFSRLEVWVVWVVVVVVVVVAVVVVVVWGMTAASVPSNAPPS